MDSEFRMLVNIVCDTLLESDVALVYDDTKEGNVETIALMKAIE